MNRCGQRGSAARTLGQPNFAKLREAEVRLAEERGGREMHRLKSENPLVLTGEGIL